MVYAHFRDDPNGRIVRELIASALREVADEVCREHFAAITQEAHLTSRIAQTLETRLHGSHFNGYTVEVMSYDIPDRGPGALESRLGGDIYVGVRVSRGGLTRLSKGFLAQAKKGTHLSMSQRRDLDGQCRKLLRRTTSSYVWVYTEHGVRVVNAQDVIRRQSRNLIDGRRLDEVLSATLSCDEGDAAIGLPDAPIGQSERSATRHSLGEILERLGTETGIGVAVTSD